MPSNAEAHSESTRTRTVWKDVEWLDFTKKFLLDFPHRDLNAPGFKLKASEFQEIQKLVIDPDRRRAPHPSVLEKASKKITIVAVDGNLIGDDSGAALSSPKDKIESANERSGDESNRSWTEADYIAIASQLHVIRPDLNLIFSKDFTGYTVKDLEEAQMSLGISKRQKILSIDGYVDGIKKALLSMREVVNSQPPAKRKKTPESIAQPGMLPKQIDKSSTSHVLRHVFWKGDDFRNIALKLCELNPDANYQFSETLKSLSANELIFAMTEALPVERHRPTPTIKTSMVKIRQELVSQFSILKSLGSVSSLKPSNPILDKKEVLDAGKMPAVQPRGDADLGSESTFNSSKIDEIKHSPAEEKINTGENLFDLSGVSKFFNSSQIESARPLVAMIADEFAKAFVSRLGESATSSGIFDILKNAIGNVAKVAVPAQSTGALVSSVSSTPVEMEDDIPLPGDKNGNKVDTDAVVVARESVIPIFASTAFDRAQSGDELDEADQQRLSRPDLHRSKILETGVMASEVPFGTPHIGLAGLRPKDSDELKYMYPDIVFTCVTRHDDQMMTQLGKCQRVIAIEGFIPVLADRMLEKTLSGKYFKALTFDNVKSIINNWAMSDPHFAMN